MTRQEKKGELIKLLCMGTITIGDLIDECFEFGQQHPHWISVEDYATDELPPLISEKDPYGESVHVLFVVELDGVQFISKGCFDYDSGMWHALETDCSYCKENVTHWMALPPPPAKLSNLERIGKNWKEKKGGKD